MRKWMIGCAAVVLGAGSWSMANAQASKDGAKSAPATTEIRYFAALGDLLGDLPVDAFIKETRQGNKVVSAVLDVCYSMSTTSDRKDRFAIELKPEGEKLSGTGQSLENKTPITVNLIRKQAGKSISFDGKIVVGTNVTSVSSPDNTDTDEKEFQQLQVVDDDLAEAPKDFTQASPQSVAVRVKREAFIDLVKSLKDQNVQIALDSIATDCNVLRTGHQVLRLIVDPARGPDLIAKLKSAPGVAGAGWTSGTYDMERAIRFAADGWRDAGKLNREKLATALASVAARVLSAKPATSTWNDTTGELTFAIKRSSQLAPELGLTETLEITALVGPDRPGASDRMIVWIGVPSSKTSDDSAGAHLKFAENSGGEEESTFNDDDGMIRALAAELKGQRWDTDKSSWK